MKTFLYRGYNRDGTRSKGVIEAHDLKDAREKLANAGVLPEYVESVTDSRMAETSATGRKSSLNRIQDRTEFYRALSALLKAGLPLAAAFEVLIEQPSGGYARSTRDIAGIRDRVRDGAGFAQALVDSSTRISAYEAAVIESGEKTGRMHDVLAQVADYLDEVSTIRATLINASIYPVVIILLALLVGVGVMGFLVPQVAAMFAESGLTLPWVTRAVIAVGHWFVPVIMPLMILSVLLLAVATKHVQANVAFRQWFERLLSRMPVLGGGFKLLVAARFSRTCSLLLHGGLPLIDAMSLSGRATGSLWISQSVQEKSEAVRHGQSFSHAMAEVPVLGPMMASWIRAGEASGDLAGLLQHAAERNQSLWAA